MTAKEQLKEISVRTHELVHVQYNTLNRSLIPVSYTHLDVYKRQEHMRELMKRLGNPQDDLKYVHVAGTNGKGCLLYTSRCV